MILGTFFKALASMRVGIENLFVWSARVGYWKVGGALVAVLAVVGVGTHFALSQSAPIPQETATRSVEVGSVSALSAGISPLSVIGEVTSKSEATVRAEASGQVISVRYELGDQVAAGAIVAELEHSSQSAAVQQAQASVDAAQANLAKIQKGTRSEQLAVLQATLEGAKSGAVNTLLSAYATVDNAVRGAADTFFSSPSSITPHFNVSTSNTQLRSNAEAERVGLGPVLQRQSAAGANLSPSDDLKMELLKAETEVRAVRTFLDDSIAVLNAGIPDTNYSASTIAGYIASATAARTSVNASLAAIASARLSLETAQKNLEQSVTGAQVEDISAAQAGEKQAVAGLAAARANLEKSIIRSPISGTINSLSLKRGDYVGATTPVLTVANNGALEVVAYITENDAREIAVGQHVSVEGGTSGTITRIAPALDPITKKIEMRVGLSGGKLVNGQSVLLSIARSTSHTSTDRITIPISAIKVEADTVSVFTVESSKLVSHTVELGALLGDRVEILSGLTSDMIIVVDARGLREGQVVEIH